MTDDPAVRNRWYEFEKLDVYRLAVELREVVMEILAKFPQIDREDADQAKRSTKSSVRNVCEGAGEIRPREKARFYRMAARSGSETGGTLRIMESDVGPDPLFDKAHTINYEFIAKTTKWQRTKRSNPIPIPIPIPIPNPRPSPSPSPIPIPSPSPRTKECGTGYKCPVPHFNQFAPRLNVLFARA